MPLVWDDDRLLHHALALARAQAAFASPNPAVGCVLTREGVLLGEGAHRYDLRDHAEIVALKQAATLGHSIQGATAYVTLEPCSHHGRTGPCADALVKAGIARCVIATLDPNPAVSGRGLAKLRAAGIEVAVAGPLSEVAQSARRLNDAFAFSIQRGRPFITLKSALSADGHLAPDPATRTVGAPHWITGPAARADVQQLRHVSDAILTGIGTVLADNPSLTDRSGLPRRRRLLRVVLDSGLRLPLDSQLVRSAQGDLLVITSSGAHEEKQRALQDLGVEIYPMVTAGGTANLLTLFTAVLGSREVRSILVEAGPTLNGLLLEHSLVDRLVLYKSPVTLGSNSLPFARGGHDPGFWEGKLSGLTIHGFPHGSGTDTRTAGYFHDPWDGVDAGFALSAL